MTTPLFIFLFIILALAVAYFMVAHGQNKLVRGLTTEPSKISTLRGTAHNTDRGAAFTVENGKTYYVDGLAAWNTDFVEQAVVVIGCVAEKNTFFYVENATWSLDEAV